MKADISKGLQNALVDYGKIVDFLTKIDKPVMLVSAEKALQNKDVFVSALVEMNIEVRDLSPYKHKAIKFITPNPKDYLDLTRTSKVIGQAGFYDEFKINGWARYLHQNKKVIVELYLDGSLVDSQIADQYRAHQLSLDNETQAYCGFSFDISKINSSCDIEIYGKGDVKPIFKLEGKC
jgi:hypothetical protein